MAGNNTDDPAWILMILIFIFILIGWLVWHFFEPQFLHAIKYIRIVETGILSPFDDRASACFSWLLEANVKPEMPTRAALEAAQGCFGAQALQSLPAARAIDFYSLTPDSLGFVGRVIGSYMKWLLFAVCIGGAYVATFVSKRNKFKTRHNLESFIKTQMKMWPVIAPIAHFNPGKTSARILGDTILDKTPLFAEAFAPEEWLSYHRISVVNGVPDRESVRRAFLQQLGPRWNGFQDLPPYMLALATAFALKGVQKRDESDDFLGQISLCWSADKGFRPTPEVMAEIRKLLKDPAVGGKALEIASKHAYRTTALLGMLKWARFMGGVLAAAQFLWLRGVDRELWYSLNNLGRRSFHSEGAGAIAHYMAEEAAHKALPTPRLDTAIVTLNIYMGGDNPVQLPPREEPSKARG